MAEVKRVVSITGSSFHAGAGNWIAKMRAGQQLRLEREPNNQYDPNAISVHIFQQCLGYCPRGVAAELAPLMDAGTTVTAVKSFDPRFAGAGVMDLVWEIPDAPEQEATPGAEPANEDEDIASLF